MPGVGFAVGVAVAVGAGVAVGWTVGVGVGDVLLTVGLTTGVGCPGGVGPPLFTLSFEKMKYPSIPIDTRAMVIDAIVIGSRSELRSFGITDGGVATAPKGGDEILIVSACGLYDSVGGA